MVAAIKPYRTVELGGIRVAYKKYLDGGGREFDRFHPFSAQTRDAAPTARVRMVCRPGLHRLLLGHGLAQTLCLADVNPAAVAACHRTVRDRSCRPRDDSSLRQPRRDPTV